MKIRRKLFFLIGIIFLCAPLSCGYQLTGTNSYLVKNIRSIYVEPFINRTRDVGVEHEMASALRSEFYRHHQVRMVDQAEDAEAIITGVIRSLDNNIAAVNAKDEVLQYEAAMVLDITLRRREPPEVLWRGPGIRLAAPYAGSRAAVVVTSSDFRAGTLNSIDVRRLTDIQLTEAQRDSARSQMIDTFARLLHQRLVEMF